MIFREIFSGVSQVPRRAEFSRTIALEKSGRVRLRVKTKGFEIRFSSDVTFMSAKIETCKDGEAKKEKSDIPSLR